MKQKEYPVRKGQVLDVEITGYTSEGAGVARVEGLAVFVAGGICGETLRVRIAHLGHTAAYADILKILTPSPARRSSGCIHAGHCGGCVFWHMSYEEELRGKAQRVTDALNRIGGFSLPGVPITGSPSQTEYRNKAQFPVGQEKNGPVAGFFRQRTHQVVPIDRCLIQSEEADKVKDIVTAWMGRHHISVYDEQSHKGLVRHIYVRNAMATGQILVCLVINGDSIPFEKELVDNLLTHVDNIVSICLSIHKKRGNFILGDKFAHIYGPGYIEDELCGLRFRLSPRSFYQVNRDQAQQLYAAAIAQAGLTGQETALDLYCGTGTITLALSRHVKKVIGVEIIPQAIEDAKDNAKRNGIENAEFLCADAAQAAEQFAAQGIRPDVIMVDPPRKGLDETVIASMVQMAPRRIVYVSCDPATLARDCKRLSEQGYTLTHAEAFDMFPRCAHVESVVALTRNA